MRKVAERAIDELWSNLKLRRDLDEKRWEIESKAEKVSKKMSALLNPLYPIGVKINELEDRIEKMDEERKERLEARLVDHMRGYGQSDDTVALVEAVKAGIAERFAKAAVDAAKKRGVG